MNKIVRITMLYRLINERDKVLYKNIIGTFGIKGLSIIINFLTTSFYISYFKDDSILGVWYTIISILQWILTFDMGIGNGLRNKIAASMNNKEKLKKYISSGYISITILSLLISIVGSIVFAISDLNSVFNIKANYLSSKTLTIIVVSTFIGIMLQFIVKIITSILYALQKNILANVSTLITNGLVLIFLIIGSRFSYNSEHKIIHIALVYSFAIIIPLFIQTVFVFGGELKGCAPRLKNFDVNYAKEVIGLGGGFFLVQLGLLFLTSTNSWLITKMFTSSDVVIYQNYYRIFSLPTMLFSLLSQPMWSGISSALYRRDFDWIKKKYNMIFKCALLASSICIILTFALPYIFRIWLGNNYSVNIITAFLFCVLSIEHVFMYAFTCLANGISKIKCQVFFALLVITFKFPVAIICKKICGCWESVILSEVILMIFIVIVQPIINNKNIKEIEKVNC